MPCRKSKNSHWTQCRETAEYQRYILQATREKGTKPTMESNLTAFFLTVIDRRTPWSNSQFAEQ